MAANPFEDPDVQAAANGGNAGADAGAGGASGNVYGGGGAYEDNPSPPQYTQAQQDIAVAVGTAVAKDAATKTADAVKQDYNQQSAQQGDHYSQPETPDFCHKLFYWLPIRYIAWIGGVCLVISPILDWIFIKTSFVYGIIGFYLFVFGVMIVFIESPVFSLTRKPQLVIYYWLRLLSRMWGRSTFYIFLSILTYSEISETFTISFVVGIYLLITAILMLIVSRQGATKYRRLFEFIAQGTDPLQQDEMSGRLTRKFDELDLDQDGKIGSLEIIKLAEQASRPLSNAERHAIQTFLDVNCNGSVSRDDFVNQFMNFNQNLKWL